jgi:hypothetical protein
MITLVCEAIPALPNRTADSAITQVRKVFILGLLQLTFIWNMSEDIKCFFSPVSAVHQPTTVSQA